MVTVLCRRTGIGVDRETQRGERPLSHVSTDTSSFPPLNTLTLSGHREQRPPSLFSPLVLQQNGQREAEEETGRNTEQTSAHGACLKCWDGHLLGTVSSVEATEDTSDVQ